jgi:hypothetical protein
MDKARLLEILQEAFDARERVLQEKHAINMLCKSGEEMDAEKAEHIIAFEAIEQLLG